MLVFNNLPTLETLVIKCINEHHNNFYSEYYPSYYVIDNNLPPTLKYLKLTGISQDCIDNIKKIPFSCVLEYEIKEDES